MRLTFICLLLTNVLLVGICSSYAHSHVFTDEIKFAKKGTFLLVYQSEMLDPVALDFELLQKIEQHRNSLEITYLALKPGVVVKILPYAEINASTFIPLNTEYIIDPLYFTTTTQKR